jgi:hypothetical protein
LLAMSPSDFALISRPLSLASQLLHDSARSTLHGPGANRCAVSARLSARLRSALTRSEW